jgi:hypothetical protein
MRIALVTLAISGDYIKMYNTLFRKSHEDYAKRHGYDFRVITEYLDDEILHIRLISFQKALVFSQPWSSQYDLIIFVDADIYIRPDSPAIHVAGDFTEKIGIVNEFAQPTKELRMALQAECGWETTATEYYKLCQFDLETDIVANTGVIVACPAKHGQYLKEIYETYRETAMFHPRGFIYEQSAIGYCLVRDNKYICLPNEWNGLWIVNKFVYKDKELSEFIGETYFTHFAGRFQYEKLYEFLSRQDLPESPHITK